MTDKEYAQEAVDNFKQIGQNPFDLVGVLSRDLQVGGELERNQFAAWDVVKLLIMLQHHRNSSNIIQLSE